MFTLVAVVYIHLHECTTHHNRTRPTIPTLRIKLQYHMNADQQSDHYHLITTFPRRKPPANAPASHWPTRPGTVGQRGSDVKHAHPQALGIYGGIPPTARHCPTSTRLPRRHGALVPPGVDPPAAAGRRAEGLPLPGGPPRLEPELRRRGHPSRPTLRTSPSRSRQLRSIGSEQLVGRTRLDAGQAVVRVPAGQEPDRRCPRLRHKSVLSAASSLFSIWGDGLFAALRGSAEQFKTTAVKIEA